VAYSHPAAFTLDIYSHVLPHMQEQAAVMTLLDVERHLLYLRGLEQRGNAEQLRRVDPEARR
jgi:hypothetical protein